MLEQVLELETNSINSRTWLISKELKQEENLFSVSYDARLTIIRYINFHNKNPLY
jgi:hypothetical protein